VQDNLIPFVKHYSFECWDVAEPNRPRPSSLYPLTPCGLGTPYVESFSSFVIRLAEAHVVSVRRLILQVLSPEHPSQIPQASTWYAYPANWLGKGSEMFLERFQAATGRSDLHLLTLVSLQGTISQPNLFRKAAAWCPNCLEQWRTEGVPVYSPLLWAIRAITVCPSHTVALVDRCPHCHSQFAYLRVSARPGYCSVCSQWLGTCTSSPKTKDCLDEYAFWAARSVGQILVAMPELQRIQPHVELMTNLQRCLSQSKGATMQSLAALSGVSLCTFLGWISGRSKPTLDHLCRLTYELKLPLMMLFKGVPHQWQGPERICQHIDPPRRKFRGQPAIGRNELQKILTAALSEDPPPSLSEVARRLKFRCTQTLCYRQPELCRQISERRRHSGEIGVCGPQLYKKSERQRLESTLRRYLARTNPLSLNEVTSKLGYKSTTSIRERCPELCCAIAAKRKQQKREQMRRALEDARTEDPPPTLEQIARRLGFTAVGVLSKAFPEMYAAHKQWRRHWFEERRKKLRLSIVEWLAVEPAPTFASVCCRFGISQTYLQERFPKENAEIIRRSTERLRIAREKRDAKMRKEVFEIVQSLRDQNIYPSLQRVNSALSQGLAPRWQRLRPVINEALLHFGVAKRNGFGQFV
jgi:transcriptional regulator with XRE-family HTH domain/AraC-like DNA-binding protein